MDVLMLMTSLVLYLATLVCDVTATTFSIPQPALEKEAHYWYNLGKVDIDEALMRPVNLKKAKNVILFLGDGMGIAASTAGRIYKGQKAGMSGEEGYLAWERFPNVGLIKTYNLDKQVPDSGATATSFLTGVKANYYTIGVNGHVKENDWQASLDNNTWLPTIVLWPQEAGKDTGVVTTTRITHATPAAAYAHVAQRGWECDSEIPEEAKIMGCTDIARQLVENKPGKDIKVLLGGGGYPMGVPVEGNLNPNEDSCFRKDSRNLVDDWIEEKRSRKKSYVYVADGTQLMDVDVTDTDFILGLFSGGHLPYESFRQQDLDKDIPTLKNMTMKAIDRLSLGEDGYFLLVEGGRIDLGLHDSKSRLALDEILAFDEAIAATMARVNIDDTLVVVTADHSHVMTINGYPTRGNDILGMTTNNDVTDDLPYTTLMYMNGFGANFTWEGGKVLRANLTSVDTNSPYFVAQSAVPVKPGHETHGGEDVAAYATGPMAHLFHRLHEQSHVAHVMSYAACIGPYESCDRPTS